METEPSATTSWTSPPSDDTTVAQLLGHVVGLTLVFRLAATGAGGRMREKA